MNMKNTERKGMSPGEAVGHIEQIRQNIMAQGNVDFENDHLNQIRKVLEKGEISPEDAVNKAQKIYDSRIER